MKRFRRLALLPGLLVTGACSVFGASNVDEPEYEVLVAEDPIEVRQYPDLAVVTTTAERDYDEATDAAFRRLFDYISGENAGERKIEMTAPVIQETEGREIAMTAPVLQEKAGERWKMAFVLPSELTADTAPRPTNPAVTLETQPGGTVAVITYSGFLDEENIAEAREQLEAWIAESDYEATGAFRSAGYNPPWTIPFLRRNEVQIPVKRE